ncbi:MAG: IS6 family transposase [Methylocella sp.]
MNDTRSTLRYPGFRFPAEIIGHAVWLYHRFTLSFRDIEDLLAEHGIIVTHETIRQWCLRFGQEYANSIRRRRPQPGDKWHLDEVFIKVCGETHYLWRAVDQNGNALDILVQSQRNAKAAKRFFKKLLKGLRYAPRVMITDKLASYGAARKQMRLSIEHRQHKGLNNRAENSHQPTRQKERQMKKFKSPGKAQRFLSAHGPINNLFRPRRHLLKATAYRAARKQAFSTRLEAIDHAVAA